MTNPNREDCWQSWHFSNGHRDRGDGIGVAQLGSISRYSPYRLGWDYEMVGTYVREHNLYGAS